jgi:hypothetical protein
MDPRKNLVRALADQVLVDPKRDVPLLELGTGRIDIFDRESQMVATWVLSLGARRLGHAFGAHNVQLLASVVLFEVLLKYWNRWDIGRSSIVLQTEQPGVEIMRLHNVFLGWPDAYTGMKQFPDLNGHDRNSLANAPSYL